MTHPEIPEEAKRLATEAVRNRMLESGDFATAAEEALAAALPHLRVQETPPLVSVKAVTDVLREFAEGEPVDGDGWVLFADDLADFHGALAAAGVFAPAPRPVVDREALVEAIHDVAVATDLAKYFKHGDLRRFADAALALLPTEGV